MKRTNHLIENITKRGVLSDVPKTFHFQGLFFSDHNQGQNSDATIMGNQAWMG